MTRLPWLSRGTVAGLLLSSAILWGCGKTVPESDTTGTNRIPQNAVSSDTTPSLTRLTTSQRDSLLFDADSLYSYGDERDTVVVTDTGFKGATVANGRIPHVTIQTATLKPDKAQPAQRIIARINSGGVYSDMGIQAGVNYVVRNSWSDADTLTWVTQIISRDSATARKLTRDPRRIQYAHELTPKVPRLVVLRVNSVALVICLDDPGCRPGHCGYLGAATR